MNIIYNKKIFGKYLITCKIHTSKVALYKVFILKCKLHINKNLGFQLLLLMFSVNF